MDRIKKHIEIKIRMFWFFASRRYIPFDDIKHIDMERLEKDDDISFNKCINCGHISTSKIKCIYCGGQEMENMS